MFRHQIHSKHIMLFGIVVFVSLAYLLAPAVAQDADKGKDSTKTTIPDDWAEKIDFRSIGPANMMGRITALAVYEKDPCIWWAASASGGLLKTTNNGITFEHQFDDQDTVSIGDVQVAQSDPEIVWVGTGESNPRNSVSWGDGVYKSTDGGKTWKNMGLKQTFQTGAIAIHPEDPDIVYVGSLGRLWGKNKERGLFKTSDGGETWTKVFYVNDATGVVDVQLNHQNPDELLIATYERQRDGFDGNDPEKKYGEGSGIYKTIDGGASFERITSGLPSCKLGRIGLDYYRKDPKFVFAIIESENIAKEPEDSPFVGVRAEDADVGAKLTDITKDGPAEKAGLKEDDIVVSVEGAIVHSYDGMMGEIRKHRAGDTVNLVVSRERKQVDAELTLAEKPKRPARRARNGRPRTVRTPFTGTLGGQAANLQEQQGEKGHEYGGVYMSDNGGTSWTRINSLNPRPMYYSHIRVDPTDRKYIYICGTSLYKSEDGGKTFTGDGGSDGIHVDHHAMWIDPRDSRHMVLGNDGGIYVTYDRMKHWDHHNHAAVGQFYHVGVDSNLNYRVYGGMQDNGSWGGPSRSAAGDGAKNSDWVRVGGGDGFITLVDPTDSDQIYFESQNGGMGRINLRTGERGFIRPRPPRGTRYRFNWKSPFILSPHNSRVFYSAGNHVFRSYDKGNKIKAISPEITNTDKGAGSALSESPIDPGVLYVGTTDGAVWMTKNGGQEWTPLYYTPEKKDDENKDDEKKDEKKSDDKPKESDESDKPSTEKDEPAETPDAAAEKSDPVDPATVPITGKWEGRMISDRIPEDRAEFSFELKLDAEGKISGEMESRRGGVLDFSGGNYDAKTGAVSWLIEGERGDREYSGVLKNGEITGEMSAGGGRFQVDFEAKRIKDPAPNDNDAALIQGVAAHSVVALLHYNAMKLDDPVSGTWKGVLEDENLPDGRVEFTLELVKDDKDVLTGRASSSAGDAELTEGNYNADKKQVFFVATNDEGDMNLEFNASIEGDSMSGTLNINGQLEIDFDATKTEAAVAQQEDQPDKPAEEAEAIKTSEEMKDEDKTADAQDQPKQETDQPQEKDESAEEEKPAALADDPVSGQWEGTFESTRGSSDFSMSLEHKADHSVAGSYETERGEGDFTEGKYEPESKKLTVVADNGRFTLEWIGEINADKFVGEIEFNGGQFSMTFEADRKSKPQPSISDQPATEVADAAKTKKSTEKSSGGKTFADLLPGPRWVSSIDASHFKAGRCYITFDGHRSDDDKSYLFTTEDFGKSWSSIRGNLPKTAGSVRVLREDIKNENLLYLGCEFSAWFSLDRGVTWTRFSDLPTVAVHEFAIHPTAGEIVAATHGRSLWIADISLLRQMTSEALVADTHLYTPQDFTRWRRAQGRGNNGTREFKGEDPKQGTNIAYSLAKSARNIELTVKNLSGDVVKRFDDASTSKGLHTFEWDLRRTSRRNRGRGPILNTGSYQVELRADGKLLTNSFDIKPDPETPRDAVAEDQELNFWLELEEHGGFDR